MTGIFGVLCVENHSFDEASVYKQYMRDWSPLQKAYRRISASGILETFYRRGEPAAFMSSQN